MLVSDVRHSLVFCTCKWVEAHQPIEKGLCQHLLILRPEEIGKPRNLEEEIKMGPVHLARDSILAIVRGWGEFDVAERDITVGEIRKVSFRDLI